MGVRMAGLKELSAQLQSIRKQIPFATVQALTRYVTYLAHRQAGGFSIWRFGMKQLPLREVMRNLGLTVTDDGYELSNPAGTARYDLHGVRTTVSGIPEHFPITLSVKGGYVPVVGDPDNIDTILGINQPKTVESVSTITIGINVDSASLTALEIQLTRIADLCERIQKTQHLGEPAEYVGQSTYKISAGQVFIGDAQIKDGAINYSDLMKEVTKQAKKTVETVIESELQPGGKIWRV
ncbi:hypothetical protein SCTVLC_1485 [Serratia symbiotica SCt-VLC]|uniref:Uncharacterized protein n=2 Tax=Serratia symbiotica TaxID=138074 RepID=A0A068RDZ7_9GAMM|nr:hypothetical protein SCTVLC_1485 [Serratia symbiotica SCt-VLC]